MARVPRKRMEFLVVSVLGQYPAIFQACCFYNASGTLHKPCISRAYSVHASAERIQWTYIPERGDSSIAPCLKSELKTEPNEPVMLSWRRHADSSQISHFFRGQGDSPCSMGRAEHEVEISRGHCICSCIHRKEVAGRTWAQTAVDPGNPLTWP